MATTSRVFMRASASYENGDEAQKMRMKELPGQNQFANLYFTRLASLAPSAQGAAQARWGAVHGNATDGGHGATTGAPSFVKTLDAEPGVQVVVVGTVYKEMKGKPNILNEVLRDALKGPDAVVDGPVDKYCGDDDVISLEDDSGRIALTGAALQDYILVTGSVVAVLGVLGEDGVLTVKEICFPGLPPQAPLSPAADEPDRFVALVSGLHLGASNADMLPLMLLSEYLTGQLGGVQAHERQASIVRLIIAGNAMCDPVADAEKYASEGVVDVLKKTGAVEQRSLAHCIAALDTFLTAVCAAMPVDLMPGDSDPCNYLLPQQPLHTCLLQHSSAQSTLNLCTNPHACTVGGVEFLGSSGQPLDDMVRYVPGEDRLGVLSQSLRMRHMAPTAPDTLGCYPFTSHDPFIMDSCPHVYFAANQPAFSSVVVESDSKDDIKGDGNQRVRVVSVPDFAREPTLVLVNVNTLECTPVTFGGLE